MMLAKVARRVKKLLWNDGCLELYVPERVEQSLAAGTGGAGTGDAGDIVERFACRVEACVPAAEQRSHVGGDHGIGHAVKKGFTFAIAQVERASNVQVNNLMLVHQRTDARLVRRVFKGRSEEHTSELQSPM